MAEFAMQWKIREMTKAKGLFAGSLTGAFRWLRLGALFPDDQTKIHRERTVKQVKRRVVHFLAAAGASLVVASLAMAWSSMIPQYESDLASVCGSPASNSCAGGYWGGVYSSLGTYTNVSELYGIRYGAEFAEMCNQPENIAACSAWQEQYMPLIEIWMYAGGQCAQLGGCGA
jgi:hypothetical protein